VQLTQWSIHNTGRKMADFALHSGSSGPFVCVGANGQKQFHSPRGKLFAIDAEGQHILTCAPHGGLIYKVIICVISMLRHIYSTCGLLLRTECHSLFVCLVDHSCEPCKVAEPVEMLFGDRLVGPGNHAFRCSAPAVWNSLPKTVLSSDSVAVF